MKELSQEQLEAKRKKDDRRWLRSVYSCKHIVYKTTNLVNGKSYIGIHKTYNLYDAYLGSGKMLQYAINKYGKDNFKRDILCIGPDRAYVSYIEAKLVTEELILSKRSYNIARGGCGGDVLVRQEDKERHRQRSKDMWAAEGFTTKNSAAIKNGRNNCESRNRQRNNLLKQYASGSRRPPECSGENNPTNIFSRQDILDIANLMAEGWTITHLSKKYNHRKDYFDELKREFNTSEFYNVSDDILSKIKDFRYTKYTLNPEEIYEKIIIHGKKYFTKKLNSKYFKALLKNNNKIMEVLI